MIVKQDNGVQVQVLRVDGGEILFDIRQTGLPHRRATDMKDGKFYQNLTIKEAKALRKALKEAIKGGMDTA